MEKEFGGMLSSVMLTASLGASGAVVSGQRFITSFQFLLVEITL